MELKPIESKSITKYVVERILEQIRKGHLRPGENIGAQRELARQLNVSMGCIREALQALELANIVETKPGKGTFVKDLTFNEIINPTNSNFIINKENTIELLELRLIFETQAVRIICEKGSDEEINKIKEILEIEHALIKDWDMDSYIKNNLNFHIKIINFTHNKILIKIYENTVRKLMDSIEQAIKKESDLNFAHKGHEEIVKYLILRDVEKSEKAMRKHLEKAIKISKIIN